MHKKGNKYKVLKAMMAKGENGSEERMYEINEIFDGNPNYVQYPASLELMEERETKKSKRGEK